ncbi:unnamed protein product [Staurois parvus]|uniref:Uncharacterized protein n=1 Tax=Staurois parvus TaxID=386267 RepID=A0ABN9ES70_9NEOB|nr:unnamed protein product [Staurois parvus]
MKGTRGISWCPLLTLGPRAVPKFPNGQSAPVVLCCTADWRASRKKKPRSMSMTGLTTHGPPGNRGSRGPMSLPTLKKSL